MRTFAKLILVLGIAVLVLAMCVSSDSHNNNGSSPHWVECRIWWRALADYGGTSNFEAGSSSWCINTFSGVTQEQAENIVDSVSTGMDVDRGSIKATCRDGYCTVTFRSLAQDKR